MSDLVARLRDQADQLEDSSDGIRYLKEAAARIEALEAAVAAFLAKWALVEPEINSRFTMAWIRGDRYAGPTLKDELLAFEQLLSRKDG